MKWISSLGPGRRVLLTWWLIGGALVAHASAGDVDDTVFLKNGGRTRGVVIEDDPDAGVQIRIPDGSVRAFKRAEIDHVEYGHSAARSEMNASAASRSNVPAPPPPSAANAPPPWPAGVSSALGSLRVESDEPGDVFIENAEYGPTPQVIQNLPAGPHRVLVRFHAGDSSSRVIGVQGGAETSVHFEATDSLNAYRVREGAHFGFGLETAVALGDEEDVIPTFRLFGRVNYAVTRVFEVRADLVLGSYGVGQWYSEDSFSYDAQGHQNAFGVSVRPDIQINWGSIYTLSLGVDLGLNSHNGLMYGVHASPLSLRFGPKREFLLNIQAGALANRDDAVLDVVAQLSYLLL